jgi:hypothetical protein
MTKRIMSDVFVNMNRTVCRRVARRGAFRGAYVVTVRYVYETPDVTALTAPLDALVKDPAIAGGEIWQAVDAAGMPVSEEERLRGGDKKIKGALIVDTLRQADGENLAERLSRELTAFGANPPYTASRTENSNHLLAHLRAEGVDRRKALVGLDMPKSPAVAGFQPLCQSADAMDRADALAEGNRAVGAYQGFVTLLGVHQLRAGRDQSALDQG